MALSRVSYVGDSVTNLFSVTFPYISNTHVKLYINGAEDTGFTWTTLTSIAASNIPATDDVVLIKRVTPTTPIVDFEDGSNLTEDMLDSATTQALYVVEESRDDSVDSVLDAIPDDSITPIKLNSAFGAWVTAVTALAARAALDTPSNAEVSTAVSDAVTIALASAITLATQTQAEAGTNNTAFMTPLRTAEAIAALETSSGIGEGQTWQDMTASRASVTDYTNNTGKPIMVNIYINASSTLRSLSVDGVIVSWFNAATGIGGALSAIVPAGGVYSISAGFDTWVELR